MFVRNSICFVEFRFSAFLLEIAMSTSEPPKPSDARPHRCAYLIDNIIDATHPWNKEGIKAAYRTFRECMKNSEVNADFSQYPKYVAPREGYEGRKQ